MQLAQPKLRALLTLALCAAIGALSAWSARGLELHSSYADLIPSHSPAIQGRLHILEQVQSTSPVVLTLTPTTDADEPSLEALAASLSSHPNIASVTTALPPPYQPEQALYLLEADELLSIKDTLRATIKRVKQQLNPLYVPLNTHANPDEVWRPLKDQLAALEAKHTRTSRERAMLHLDQAGRLRSSDLTSRYLIIEPTHEPGQMTLVHQSLAHLHAQLDAFQRSHPHIKASLTGRMIITAEEHDRLRADLNQATAIAAALIIACMLIWLRRPSALLSFGAPLVFGVLVTLALTRLCIGQLNLVSGFIIPVLAGLGVDFCIHLYMAYTTLQRRGVAPAQAITQARAALWAPCLASAATSAAAFLALSINDFKGVREYGLIAAGGIMVMWASTFIIMPALLRLMPGSAPKPRAAQPAPSSNKHPRWLNAALIIGALLTAFGLAYAPKITLKNDFTALRGDSEASTRYLALSQQLNSAIDPTIIMLPSLDQATRALDVIDRQRRLTQATSAPRAALGHAIGSATFLPRDLETKTAIIAALRAELEPLQHQRARLTPQAQAQVEQLTRMFNAAPWRQEQLPALIKTALTTKDQRGHLVLLWKRGELEHDHEYESWTRVLEGLERQLIKEGLAPKIFDETSITTEVLRLLKQDLAAMILAAAALTMLILGLTFRRLKAVALAASSLLLALLVMIGLMASAGLSFNLFNAVVIPSIVGIGIDNAVHVMHTWQTEPARFKEAIKQKLPALSLSTLTTGIGFGAMISAHHYGVQTLGALAIIGVLCSFIYTSALLPALLLRRSSKDEPPPGSM